MHRRPFGVALLGAGLLPTAVRAQGLTTGGFALMTIQIALQ